MPHIKKEQKNEGKGGNLRSFALLSYLLDLASNQHICHCNQKEEHGRSHGQLKEQ